MTKKKFQPPPTQNKNLHIGIKAKKSKKKKLCKKKESQKVWWWCHTLNIKKKKKKCLFFVGVCDYVCPCEGSMSVYFPKKKKLNQNNC